MASRLTDKQKKKIIADYVESGSYRATAKKFGVSDNTVKNICAKSADIAQKCAPKKRTEYSRYVGIYGFQKRTSTGYY